MTSDDNRGPLEDLYGLKFPNCDRQGLYNLKQVSLGQSAVVLKTECGNYIIQTQGEPCRSI